MKVYYETELGKLYHGDCLEIMPHLGPVDLVLTDPPYGTTACSWDTVIPFELMWKQLKRITKKNGAIVLFGSQPFTSALVMSNPKMFKYEWVWDKGVGVNFLHVKKEPMKVNENIVLFCEGNPTYNPQKTKRDKPIKKSNNVAGESSGYTLSNNKYVGKVYNDKYPETIIRISSRGKGRGLHPTQKPVALMEYLIKTYTIDGEMVLDFAMGSGTTGVACKNLNRNFIGIELDEMYCEIAYQRLRKEIDNG